MFLRRTLLLLALTLTLGVPTGHAASRPHLVVEAGDHDRTNTLVSFVWPLSERSGVAIDENGRRLPVQVTGSHAWMIEPGLGRSTSRRYELRPSRQRSPGRSDARARTESEQVILTSRGREVARYTTGAGSLPRSDIPERYRRAGYLHPLRTPSGTTVTGDYPSNHVHHHGIWAAWTRAEFEARKTDFWNMGDSKGRVDFEGLDVLEQGSVFAAFRSRHAYRDLTASPPVTALNERWSVRLIQAPEHPAYHLLDFAADQICATDRPVVLPTYHYGGFAFRGLEAWEGAGGARYLDSNGATNRVAANESRVRWCWIGGPVDGPGSLAGIAFLSHPTNFRAPEPVRVHPTEPYLCFAPSQLGPWSIKPGTAHRMMYRLVILDGAPDPALLDQLWNDFAHPPTTRVE